MTTSPYAAETPALHRGPGTREHESPAPNWGGKKAARYTELCLATYGRVCWLCGLPGADSADHIIPRAEGGAVYDLANLGPAHRSCNYARGKRDHAGAAALVEDGTEFFRTALPDHPAQPGSVHKTTPKKTDPTPPKTPA